MGVKHILGGLSGVSVSTATGSNKRWSCSQHTHASTQSLLYSLWFSKRRSFFVGGAAAFRCPFFGCLFLGRSSSRTPCQIPSLPFLFGESSFGGAGKKMGGVRRGVGDDKALKFKSGKKLKREARFPPRQFLCEMCFFVS